MKRSHHPTPALIGIFLLFLTALQAPAANAAHYYFAQNFSDNLKVYGYFGGDDSYHAATNTPGKDGKLNMPNSYQGTQGDMAYFRFHYSGSALFNHISCYRLDTGMCGFSPYGQSELAFDIGGNKFDEESRLSLFKNAYHNGVWGTWFQTFQGDSLIFGFFPSGSGEASDERRFTATGPMTITPIEKPPIDTPLPAALWLFMSALSALVLPRFSRDCKQG